MPMLPLSTALLLGAGALAAGALGCWAWFCLRIGTEFVPVDAHRQELMSLRRRYRRRLRALRDSLVQHKLAAEDLRGELRVAESHQQTQDKLLAAARAESADLHQRLAAQEAAAARAEGLARELEDARGRIADFERDHGLLRIERDELAARTQRLRALAPAGPAAAPAGPVPDKGPSRTDLADRNARIHELECQLRESESRLAELQSSLNTWKYRIAPLALHMQRQRDRKRRPPEPAAAAPADDLQRIRGIGRGLQRKLRAAGIARFEQLAGLSPAELANLALQLGVAASRPQRERWAEQARDLAQGGPAGTAPESRSGLA